MIECTKNLFYNKSIERSDIPMELKSISRGIGIMAIATDGIVAISDSVHSYDSLNADAKRVFIHNDFILINAGETDLLTVEDKHIDISNYITKAINDSNTLNDFLKKFSQSLVIDKDFYFIIGTKDNGKYEIAYYKVNQNRYTKQFADKEISYRHHLLQGIDNINIQNPMTCEELSGILREYVDMIIRLNRKITNTAYVGGKIQCEILQ